MNIKKWRLLGLVLFALSILVLPAAALAAGTATPEEAVSALVKPFYTPGAGGGTCDAVTGKVDGCPVTTRLLDRLQHPDSGPGSGNIVGRTQNPPQSVSISLLDNNGQTSRVNTRWQYGSSSYTITFVATKQADGWAVDDSYCAGHPETSIYNAPTGPCQADTTSTPGMPNTGNPEVDVLSIVLLTVGGLVVLAGVVLTVLSSARNKRDIR